VLYDQLTPLRRIELHRRLGHVLEDLYAPTREDHLAELAYHFYEASLGGNADKAIDYATRAARHARQIGQQGKPVQARKAQVGHDQHRQLASAQHRLGFVAVAGDDGLVTA
jgi:hypothetical protein